MDGEEARLTWELGTPIVETELKELNKSSLYLLGVKLSVFEEKLHNLCAFFICD